MITQTRAPAPPVVYMKHVFCELTLYAMDDILAWNPDTGLFYTRNGGLYRLINQQIEHLEGPSPDPEERI